MSALPIEIFAFRKDRHWFWLCSRSRQNIESRKFTRSNEFRNWAEEKLSRKVTRDRPKENKKRLVRDKLQGWRKTENIPKNICENYLRKTSVRWQKNFEL